MEKRLYVVSYQDGARRLVLASNRAQALRHVAELSFSVRTPTAAEAARLAGDGIKVEVAGKDGEEE